MIVALIAVVVVAVLAAGVGAIALKQKQSFAAANEVVPGRPTQAPGGWAGAHSPEAKLHRRLGDAVRAMQANPVLADAAFMDARAGIENAAIAIDERLIAAAALGGEHRARAIAAVEPDVAALESSIASLASTAVSAPVSGHAAGAVRDAQDRIDALAAARAELEAADPLVSAAEQSALDSIADAVAVLPDESRREPDSTVQSEPQTMPATPPRAEPAE